MKVLPARKMAMARAATTAKDRAPIGKADGIQLAPKTKDSGQHVLKAGCNFVERP